MGTATNILIGGARVFYAPVGEAQPDETTVDYGAAWGGNWVEVGFTNAPLAWANDLGRYEAMVQQSILPQKRQITEQHSTFETSLVELTSTLLEAAMPGTVTTVAAGASQDGYDTLAAGGEWLMDERAWGIEGVYVESDGTKQPLRVFIHKGTSVINGSIEFNREAEAGIPLLIEALEDSTQSDGEKAFLFQRVTAEKTS